MTIPLNVIANADDLGLSLSINKAILHCFEQGYINSTSLLVNTDFFDETIGLIHQNPSMYNIGVHINLAEGKPVTNFKQFNYLDENGNWNFKKVNRKFNFFSSETRLAFSEEIYAQIDKALSNKLPIVHIDSHCHLHTLPCFYKLFLNAANQYKLKIRLAQTYFEGNYLNYYYRKYLNNILKTSDSNYSDYFEDVKQFFKNKRYPVNKSITELMLHPDYDPSGKLLDHFDVDSLQNWIDFLKNN